MGLSSDSQLWRPQSRPQWLAILSEADELFYGGQAGGGKTDLILGAAICLHRDSVVFRREYRQMVGAQGIIDRSREIIGTHGRYNGQEHVWRDLPGDRSIEFGSIQYDRDKHAWQGRPHDLKAFDEITEFLESQYTFIIRWNRTAHAGQRSRVIATGNPPMHAEGRWVIRYWAPWLDEKHPNPARPGELRYFVQLDDQPVEVDGPEPFPYKGEQLYPRSRTFIPAALSDNPYLGDDYLATLQGAPEPLRSQLLYGDFTIGVQDDEWQVVPTDWVREAQARWRPDGATGNCDAVGCDPSRGGVDEFAICKRYGVWFELVSYPASAAKDGEDGAGLIAKALLNDRGAPDINIDVIGIGSSVYDHAKRALKNVRAVNVADATNATDKTGKFRMRNVRAAMYWAFREALDPKDGEGLALPPDSQLLGDLTAARYKVTAQGIQIEDKEAMKERLGRSPDRGEAVMLAHWNAKPRWGGKVSTVNVPLR